jgi:hypothetical protein
VLICFAMPLELLRTAVGPLIRKPGVPWARHLPLMFGLALAFSAGELMGLLTQSAGRSPHSLE